MAEDKVFYAKARHPSSGKTPAVCPMEHFSAAASTPSKQRNGLSAGAASGSTITSTPTAPGKRQSVPMSPPSILPFLSLPFLPTTALYRAVEALEAMWILPVEAIGSNLAVIVIFRQHKPRSPRKREPIRFRRRQSWWKRWGLSRRVVGRLMLDDLGLLASRLKQIIKANAGRGGTNSSAFQNARLDRRP